VYNASHSLLPHRETTPTERVPSRLDSAWVVVGGLAIIGFVLGGAGAVAIGLFISPMMEDLGWQNSKVSAIATAYNLAGLLTAPALGVGVDRFGAKRIVASGVALSSMGFLFASYAHTWYGLLAAFSTGGVGYVASVYVPTAVIVTSWMEDKKNLGMGVVWGALSLGAASFSPLIGWGIDSLGWRTTSQLLAAIVAALLPVMFITIREKSSDPVVIPLKAQQNHGGLSVGRAFRSNAFIAITLSSTLFATGMMCVNYHVVSIFMQSGYSLRTAGTIYGASWLLSGIGSVCLGLGAVRIGAKATLSLGLLSSAAGILCLLGSGDHGPGIISVTAFVVLWGASANSANQLIPVILADKFGLANLGTLVGAQSFVMGVMSAGGPVITGLLYDRFSNYRFGIYASTALTLLAFVIASRIPMRASTPRT
jgi:MFS family permease